MSKKMVSISISASFPVLADGCLGRSKQVTIAAEPSEENFLSNPHNFGWLEGVVRSFRFGPGRGGENND